MSRVYVESCDLVGAINRLAEYSVSLDRALSLGALAEDEKDMLRKRRDHVDELGLNLSRAIQAGDAFGG